TSSPTGFSAARNAISAKARDTSPSTLFSDRPSNTAPRNARLSDRPTPSARSPTRLSSIDTSPISRANASVNRSSVIGESLHHPAQLAAVGRCGALAGNAFERRRELARRQAPEFLGREPQHTEAQAHRIV